jgi:hypothetical protein
MTSQEIEKRLEVMKGKTFLYMKHEHVIESFFMRNAAKEFMVVTNRCAIERMFHQAHVFFDSFKPKDVTTAKALVNLSVNEPLAAEPLPASGNHQPSSVIVYSSTQYSRFMMINGNRSINVRKVNKIIKEIEGGNDMLQYYPIQVKERNERLEILDGQHRFYIDKKLKRPVYYILIEEDKSMPEIAMVNSNVEKWKSTDFLNCYIQQGNLNYKELEAFVKEYGLSIGLSLKLLYYGNPRVEGTDDTLSKLFQQGGFEVKHAAAAYTFAEECKQFNFFKNWSDRGFLIAIYRIKQAGLIPLEDVLATVKKRQEMLTPQKSYKEYIWNLEQIVNAGKQKRITLI